MFETFVVINNVVLGVINNVVLDVTNNVVLDVISNVVLDADAIITVRSGDDLERQATTSVLKKIQAGPAACNEE